MKRLLFALPGNEAFCARLLQNLDGVWATIEQALAEPPHPAR